MAKDPDIDADILAHALGQATASFTLRIDPHELARFRSRTRKLNMSLNAFLRSAGHMALHLSDREILRIAAARAAESQSDASTQSARGARHG